MANIHRRMDHIAGTTMADNETKMAAATLACEASRQQLAVMTAKGPRDVPGELLQLYSWFLDRMSTEQAGAAKPGTAPRSW